MGAADASGSGPVGGVVLVVARWTEDVSWLDAIPHPAIVVQKDRDCPNVGREAASWLWFMETARIDPRTTYAFLQGDPFPHAVTAGDLRPVDRFTPIGGHVYRCDREAAPQHAGLPLVRCARDWFGAVLPDEIVFHAGAQFLIPGRVIRRRSRRWYADLRRMVEAEEKGAWVLERMWGLVWRRDRTRK